jgi:hypothetical protein
MSIWRRIAVLAVAFVLACSTALAEEKTEKPASLDLSPSSIAGRTVTGDEPVYFLVRLKAGSQELSDITLSTFSNDGLEAKPEPDSSAKVASLPVGAEQTWKVKVTPVKPGVFTPGTLSVQVAVAYREGDKKLQRNQFQALTITAPGAVTVANLADIDFKGTLTALSEQRPGQLFVTITNKSAQPLEVTNIQVNAPRFITAKPDFKPLQLPFGGVQVVPIAITVADQIVPGQYPLVVVASLKTPSGLSGSAVKAQDVDIAVLGESDILSKIGAPSLLFLPGVLFLLAWQLLWSLNKDKAQRQGYWLVPTAGGFWVVAVALALAAAYAYPWIMQHAFHRPRNYLVAYGFVDYALAFAMSIGAAAVLYPIWLLMKWLKAQYVAWRLRETTPAVTDRPIDIIGKLGRNGQAVTLPRAHPAGGANNEVVYILETWSKSPSIWVVPPARLEDGPQADANSRNVSQNIAAGGIIDAAELHRLLQDGIEAQWWTLTWQAVAGVTTPRSVAETAWTKLPAPGGFIRGP